ncbi:MAG: type 1 glutamine amidotransferase [Herminiimonas sp.]|nr:type 1 glutamine amidotransferase [Herminiimonas sp.]
MDQKLAGLTIAALVTDGFEQVELTGPRIALEEAGASVRIVSTKRGKVQGFNHDAKADQFDVDLTFDEADAEEFDALLLPGGVMNSDQIRTLAQAQKIAAGMQESGRPVAVICHGAWLLISAKLVKGKTLTSWPSLQDDLRNAGANWVDQEVVVDGNLISSRKPDDIPAFSAKLIDVLAGRLMAQARGTQDQVRGVGAGS